MKFHFEPNLDYQQQAIEAVCDIFRGQEICRTEFTVIRQRDGATDLFSQNDLGIGNRLKLLDDEILANLKDVQIRNGLRPSESIESGDFTVEMETGTGKTYVYLRTVLELNKRYGFTKFVIVVPSVAIKEGVYKSLQMMEGHFRSLYAGVPINYFIYDSANLEKVRTFATSPNIQIMIVTIQSLVRKGHAVVYKPSEKTGDAKPIELICATRPILIVDEPQSVDGGLSGAGKAALDAMSPLCTLRYSATHKHKHHMVYSLDAVDAYEKKLVKQIEVAAATIDGGHNKPYAKLISVSNRRGKIAAELELDVQSGGAVVRQAKAVQDGDKLEMTTGRSIYRDCRVGEIRTAKGEEFMELRVPGGEHYLKIGQSYGDVDHLAVQRQMIQKTIKEHLTKELRLASQGIKVLSLFFIDSVEKYRKYDPDGRQEKGEYALIFEEEYQRLAKHPDYQSLFKEVDVKTAAQQVHDGYFSIDKKGSWANTNEDNQVGIDNAERAYNLIMKDKEKLLSFETPLKFIFSHSALREGWDNPNVFQICALRNMGTERERRQTIGRGLRLCVNQRGERQRGHEINTLTVIANESYEQFAEQLQQEIESETGIRFGVVESHQFAGIVVTKDAEKPVPMGFEQSKAIWEHLRSEGLVSSTGKIQDTLRQKLKDGTFILPEPFAAQTPQVKEILRKLAGRLEIKNAAERKQVKTRQAVLYGEEFKALWDRIKHKTTYRVNFDNEVLIDACIKSLKEAPRIARTRLQWRTADIVIGRSGVDTGDVTGAAPTALEDAVVDLPDILTDLQDKTQLTRRSIYRILIESGRLEEFKLNPQQFIELATKCINDAKQLVIVNGIKYQRIGGEEFYAQELFETRELMGYLRSMVESNKGVYEQVVYQSNNERAFAEQLERNEAIKVYAKLPGWFSVSTPLGAYTPDWAVVVSMDGVERLYLVVETKGDLFEGGLRGTEAAKVACGTAHFAALATSAGDNPAEYRVTTDLDKLLEGCV